MQSKHVSSLVGSDRFERLLCHFDVYRLVYTRENGNSLISVVEILVMAFARKSEEPGLAPVMTPLSLNTAGSLEEVVCARTPARIYIEFNH